VLETDGGEFLPESNAILFYLAEGTTLLPEGRFGRARILQWMFFEMKVREVEDLKRQVEKLRDLIEARRSQGQRSYGA
jgi:glutathione S-transferase